MYSFDGSVSPLTAFLFLSHLTCSLNTIVFWSFGSSPAAAKESNTKRGEAKVGMGQLELTKLSPSPRPRRFVHTDAPSDDQRLAPEDK